MSEVETCQDSDSSSSSSSRKGGFLSVTNNSHQGQQQQEISLPQLQKLSSSAPVSPFSTNNNNTPKSNTSKPLIRPKIMQQKLDIPPRQFAALNVKSVVSVTNNNNNTNLSHSTSPARFSSISSASVNSQQQQNQQNQQALQQDSAASSFSCSSSAMQSPQPQQTSNFQFAPVTTDGQLEQQQQQRSSNNFNASLVHPRIYLGSAMDAMYAAELVARGIFYILNVAYECDFSDSVLACDRIKTKKIDLRDTISENIERSFDEAFAFIDEAVNDRNHHDSKILVHCFVGSSRSPSVVIAYLMKKLAEQDQQQQGKHEHEQQQKQQQQFTHIKNSIITRHQEQVHRQNQGSPTMMDALLAPQHSQQQQQQQDDDDPFAHVDESAIASFVIASTSQQQQQQQQKAQSNFPSTSTSSSTSSTSSTTSSTSSSYYRSVLGRVQRIRPEVLPNFAFACALQRMDDQLLLRATA